MWIKLLCDVSLYFEMNKRILLLILIIAAGVVCLILIALFHPRCPINRITGLYCPGCGTTRGCLALLHLDFYQAVRYNPFVFTTFPIFISYTVYVIYVWVKTRNFYTGGIHLLLLYAGVFCLYGVLRNLDMFSFLQPTTVH